MAITVHVNGGCLVKIDANRGDGLQSLGYTGNGASIREVDYTENVPGDQNGGDSGPPIDVQYFGSHHEIDLEFTNWDASVAAPLMAKVNNGTAGVLPIAGSLMLSGALYYRLVLTGYEPRNYLYAFLRNGVEINKGTKFSRLRLQFFAMASGPGGTLYNTTTT